MTTTQGIPPPNLPEFISRNQNVTGPDPLGVGPSSHPTILLGGVQGGGRRSQAVSTATSSQPSAEAQACLDRRRSPTHPPIHLNLRPQPSEAIRTSPPLITKHGSKEEKQPTVESEGGTTQEPVAFVKKLYQILEESRQANPSLPTPLISWNDSGQRFVVHDSAEFSRSILPKYFKHNNWQSFNRQLNLYRFRKTNNLQHARTGQRGCLIWEFSHPFFKRGGKAQLFKVRRKDVKEKGTLLRSVGREGEEGGGINGYGDAEDDGGTVEEEEEEEKEGEGEEEEEGEADGKAQDGSRLGSGDELHEIRKSSSNVGERLRAKSGRHGIKPQDRFEGWSSSVGSSKSPPRSFQANLSKRLKEQEETLSWVLEDLKRFESLSKRLEGFQTLTLDAVSKIERVLASLYRLHPPSSCEGQEVGGEMEELERSLEGFKAFLRLARHEEDGQATIRKQAEELEPSPRLNATSASIKSVEEQVLDRKGSNPSEQGMEPNLDPEVNRTQTKRDPNLISDLCHQSSETGPPPSLPSNGFPEADIGHRARWNPRKESIQRDLQPRKNPSRSFRDEGSVDPDPRLLETAVRSRSQDGSGEGVEGIPPFTLAEDPASNPLLLLLPTKRGGESSGTRSEEGNGSTNVGLQPEPQIRVEEVWKRSGDSVRNSNPASSSLSILRNPPPTSQVEEGGGGGVVPSERSRGEKIGPPKRGGGKRGGLKVRNRCLVTTSSKTLNELLESFGLIGQVQDDQDQYQETSTTVRLMTDGRVVKEGNSHKPQIFEKEEGEENQPVSEEGPSPPPPPPPPPLHPSSPSADRSDQVPSRKNEKLVEMTTTVGIEGDLLQARVCSSQQTFLQPEEEEEEEEEGGGFLSRKPSSLQLGIDQDGSEDHPRLEEVVEEEFQGNEVGVEEERGSDSNRIGNQGRDQEEYDDDDDDEDSPPIPGYPSINMPATTFLPDHGTTSLDHHHFLPRHHHRNQHPFSSSPTTCRGGGGGGGLLNPEEVVVILASSLEPHPHRPTVDVVIDRKRSSSPVIEAEVGDESMLASRGGERGSFGSDSSENRDWKRMRI